MRSTHQKAKLGTDMKRSRGGKNASGEAQVDGLGKRSPLRRQRGTPLYHQLFLIFRDQIRSGRYQDGELFPTEDQLSSHYGVSRITVRSALKNLTAAGLVEKRQGVGTFVQKSMSMVPMHVPIRNQQRHIEELSKKTTIKVVEASYGPLPPELKEWFRRGTSEKFLKLVRIRSARKPVLLLTTYTPFHDGDPESVEAFGLEPHFELLARAGVEVTSGDHYVSAILADATVAAHLEIGIGEPLLRMRYFDYDSAGVPVRYLEVLADPAEFELHITVDSD